MLVKTRRSERAAARPDRHLALLEVGEEVVPFFLGRGPVLFAGSGCTSASDERAMGFDRFHGVNGFVAHCCINCFVPAYDLGDVRW